MSQTFTEDCYDPDHVADTDLENMEDNFTTLKSSFEGGASPSNPVAGMRWFDSNKKVNKYRNAANSAWIGQMHGDGNQKIPVYRNDQLDGWLIDSGVSDCVVAIKGGSQAYNVAAGQVASTWTQPDHELTESEIPSHDHGSAGSHLHTVNRGTGSDGQSAISWSIQYGGTTTENTSYSGTHTHTSFGGSQPHNHGSAHRPRGAICTLQYLDL